MYRKIDLYEMDVDWFCVQSRHLIHAASNGEPVPQIYTIETLNNLQKLVEEMPSLYDVEINYNQIIENVGELYDDDSLVDSLLDSYSTFIEEIIPPSKGNDYNNQPKWLNLYTWSFVQMAQKGFFSFDWNEIKGEYYLVAYPKNPDLVCKKKFPKNKLGAFLERELGDLCELCDKHRDLKNMPDFSSLIRTSIVR